MNDFKFDFDVINYVILQDKENNGYYAMTKKNWEDAVDLMNTNVKENKDISFAVDTILLKVNMQTKQMHLTNQIHKLLIHTAQKH